MGVDTWGVFVIFTAVLRWSAIQSVRHQQLMLTLVELVLAANNQLGLFAFACTPSMLFATSLRTCSPGLGWLRGRHPGCPKHPGRALLGIPVAVIVTGCLHEQHACAQVLEHGASYESYARQWHFFVLPIP